MSSLGWKVWTVWALVDMLPHIPLHVPWPPSEYSATKGGSLPPALCFLADQRNYLHLPGSLPQSLRACLRNLPIPSPGQPRNVGCYTLRSTLQTFPHPSTFLTCLPGSNEWQAHLVRPQVFSCVVCLWRADKCDLAELMRKKIAVIYHDCLKILLSFKTVTRILEI